jgi:hypothetical protein
MPDDQLGLEGPVKLTGAGFLTEPDVLPAQGRSAPGAAPGWPRQRWPRWSSAT